MSLRAELLHLGIRSCAIHAAAWSKDAIYGRRAVREFKADSENLVVDAVQRNRSPKPNSR